MSSAQKYAGEEVCRLQKAQQDYYPPPLPNPVEAKLFLSAGCTHSQTHSAHMHRGKLDLTGKQKQDSITGQPKAKWSTSFPQRGRQVNLGQTDTETFDAAANSNTGAAYWKQTMPCVACTLRLMTSRAD